MTDRRVAFRYDGLDGVQRLTHLAFSEPARIVPPETDGDGVGVMMAWTMDIGPGEVRELGWTTWLTERPAPDAARDELTDRIDLAALLRPCRQVDGDEGAAAYRGWERGTTSVGDRLGNLVVKRSVADLRLLMNDGPGPGERYIAAGIHGSRRSSGRMRSSPRSRPCRSAPSWPSRP